jgi:hypothetical protein
MSGPALAYFKKSLGKEIFQKAKSPEDVQGIFSDQEIRKPPEDDPEIVKHPELQSKFYQRKIGGQWYTKLMSGTIGRNITR